MGATSCSYAKQLRRLSAKGETMSETDRAARIEQYREESRRVDELAESGKKEEVLPILEANRAKAVEHGDEDYVALFDAELLQYSEPDYPRQIDRLKEGLRWAEEQELPADFFLLRCMGVYHGLKGDEDAAIEWFDKALAENPNDWNAMRNRGVSLSKKGDADGAIEWFDKALAENPNDWNAMRERGVSLWKKGDEDGAIEWFDKALAENPNDWNAMRNRGVSLSEKGDQDGAIEWFDKALAENPKDWHTMRQRGVSLSKKGDADGAIEWYNKALAVNPNDSHSSRERSVCEWNRGNRQEAMKWLRRAVELDPDRWTGDFRAICKIIGVDADAELKTLFPDKTPEEPKPEDSLKELPRFIEEVRSALGEQAKEYIEKQENAKKKLDTFLKTQSRLDPTKSLLLVLRRWNSYTPALPSNEEKRSLGGGYFLWHNGHGTVIDPGYDFIENFDEAGCRIRDVDNVILTHAHNDHTMDFESLQTLLFKFNQKAKKEGHDLKKVRFFLNNGAFMKFSGLLNLKNTDYVEHIATLNPGGQFELSGGGTFDVLPAYHDEVLARDQAVGLFFRLRTSQEERSVVFTADTGLFPLDQEASELVADASDMDAEVWRKYLKAGVKEPDVMVVHIGAIHPDELTSDLTSEPVKACYPNHLGLIGAARVVVMCRPKLAVISEFGEEMKRFRTELVEKLQTNMLTPMFRGDDSGPKPRAVPGDLALIYDLAEEKFYSCVSLRWRRMADIDFADGKRVDSQEADDSVDDKNVDPRGVYYFAKDQRKKYAKKLDFYVNRFREARRAHSGMYFRKDAD